jgi:hypothetical protein
LWPGWETQTGFFVFEDDTKASNLSCLSGLDIGNFYVEVEGLAAAA